MSVQRGLLVIVLGAFGCYSVNYSAAHYACTTVQDCPDNQSCVAGVCTPVGPLGGADLSGGDLSGADLTSGAPPADLSGAVPPADLHSVVPPADMHSVVPPDMMTRPQDLTSPPKTSPCAGNTTGYQVGAGGSDAVLACPGNFTAGKAGTLCPPSYHLCSDTTKNNGDADPLKNMSIALCNQIGGLFAADVLASFGMVLGDLVCFGVDIPDPFALPGCGQETNVRATQNGNNCLNFTVAFPCDKTTPWDCGSDNNNLRLSHASHMNNANQGGVLCCKN